MKHLIGVRKEVIEKHSVADEQLQAHFNMTKRDLDESNVGYFVEFK